MRKPVAVAILFCVQACAPFLLAQDDSPPQALFPADELDNLLAPVALYPDPLLAQILIAATFPDQIDEAAQFCRNDPDPGDIDVQVWDVSVKALAHYPTVLNKLASHLDWAAALGEAYVTQPDDVMDSIQRLRQEAMDAGNLVDTPEQEVIVDGDDIEIWPAQDEYIYVPMYDPSRHTSVRADASTARWSALARGK